MAKSDYDFIDDDGVEEEEDSDDADDDDEDSDDDSEDDSARKRQRHTTSPRSSSSKGNKGGKPRADPKDGYCTICKVDTGDRQDLLRHRRTKPHLAKRAEVPAAASAAAGTSSRPGAAAAAAAWTSPCGARFDSSAAGAPPQKCTPSELACRPKSFTADRSSGSASKQQQPAASTTVPLPEFLRQLDQQLLDSETEMELTERKAKEDRDAVAEAQRKAHASQLAAEAAKEKHDSMTAFIRARLEPQRRA